jgi:hypothetical protein
MQKCFGFAYIMNKVTIILSLSKPPEALEKSPVSQTQLAADRTKFIRHSYLLTVVALIST